MSVLEFNVYKSQRMTGGNNKPNILTFELLEDVLSLPSSQYEPLLALSAVSRIGPLVEYAYHDIGSAHRRLSSHGHSMTAKQLEQAIGTSSIAGARSLSLDSNSHHEFIRTPQERLEMEDSRWLAFCQRLVDAAVKSGLQKSFARALVGTFEEMTSNIIEHSNNPLTGLAGYQWRPGEFEYVVVDGGIGVLESLRKHSDYNWVLDSGQALEVALQDGESRFGRAAHRGTGFHTLTTNIALRNSVLRFRSGDHSYTMDGTTAPLMKEIQSCSPFPGFLTSITTQIPKA